MMSEFKSIFFNCFQINKINKTKHFCWFTLIGFFFLNCTICDSHYQHSRAQSNKASVLSPTTLRIMKRGQHKKPCSEWHHLQRHFNAKFRFNYFAGWFWNNCAKISLQRKWKKMLLDKKKLAQVGEIDSNKSLGENCGGPILKNLSKGGR